MSKTRQQPKTCFACLEQTENLTPTTPRDNSHRNPACFHSRKCVLYVRKTHFIQINVYFHQIPCEATYRCGHVEQNNRYDVKHKKISTLMPRHAFTYTFMDSLQPRRYSCNVVIIHWFRWQRQYRGYHSSGNRERLNRAAYSSSSLKWRAFIIDQIWVPTNRTHQTLMYRTRRSERTK